MPNYSNTIIYKLCCKDTSITDIYIGSTCNKRRRKHDHKSRYNTNKNFKVYKFIREYGGWDNWDMIMVEEYPCENKFQKERRERYWLENLGASLNSCIPTRTGKEWREDNNDIIKEKKKIYREDNKDIIKEKKKVYYEDNKDIIREKKKVFYEDNKERILVACKKYRDNNKEKISQQSKKYYEKNKGVLKEKNKEYREKNRETLNKKKLEKFNCPCGGTWTKGHGFKRHEKTNKHQDYLKLQEQ